MHKTDKVKIISMPQALNYLVESSATNARALMMCAELAGDFHLGDSRQLTDKSLLPFDLVF